jgi:hypothetical protein
MKNIQKYFAGDGFNKKTIAEFKTPENKDKMSITLREMIVKRPLNEVAPLVAAAAGAEGAGAAEAGAAGEAGAGEGIGKLAKLPETPVNTVAKTVKNLMTDAVASLKGGDKQATG